MTTRDLLIILRRKFWLVPAGALIAGVVALALSLIWPPTYRAEALLLITKLRPEITLDNRFRTVSEENVVNLSVQEDQVRRQTLVGLATSPDIALQVIEQLGDRLEPANRTVAYLEGATEVRTLGNLIVLTAKHRDPDIAAAIANAWAAAYEENVNRLYTNPLPSEAQIGAQLATAQSDYEAAQRAVEDFVQESPENELARQIEQKKQLLADLQSAHLAAARQRMDKLLARVSRIDRLLLDARGLEAQLADASPSDSLTPGEQLALLSIMGGAYAQEDVQPVTLELGESWVGGDGMTVKQGIGHLARLVAALERARTTTRAEVEALSLALLGGEDLLTYGPDGASVDGIRARQAEINALQAELERQTAQKRQLQNARDVAEETYLTLTRKATEVQILSEVTGVEVLMAAKAQAPRNPSSPAPLLVALLGAMAGGLIGLALAFLVELWPGDEQPRRGR